jgi:hypothetical protein
MSAPTAIRARLMVGRIARHTAIAPLATGIPARARAESRFNLGPGTAGRRQRQAFHSFEARKDIRITDAAPIVRAIEGELKAGDHVRRSWGWPGQRGKPVYNFRSEGCESTSGRCIHFTVMVIFLDTIGGLNG